MLMELKIPEVASNTNDPEAVPPSVNVTPCRVQVRGLAQAPAESKKMSEANLRNSSSEDARLLMLGEGSEKHTTCSGSFAAASQSSKPSLNALATACDLECTC